MFKNLKIGVRLGAGFAIVILLLVVIAFIGVTRMSAINTDLNDIVNDKFPKTVQANDMVDSLNVIARRMRNALLENTAEKVQKELDDIPAQRKIIGERLEKLEATIHSEKGKEKLAKLKEIRAAYVPLQDKFIELTKAGKKDEAVDLMLSQIRKIQADYFKAINDLITFQSDLMVESGKEAQATFEAARNLMLILSIVATLLGIAIGFWVTRSITKPLGVAVGVADELAQGNLTVKIDVDSKDETGLLLASMSNMVGKLSHIISEVTTAGEALNNAAGQVSQTAQSLSQSSSEQAASVEETTASIEQMTASITQNTENAKVTDNMAT
ncbi:MAG: MCP four helix bundle domain-containing protein, partial [Rhodocyclaceae bacterium]|nr:MCP four helix bundle domain-containing protein [Rhodocyclaceae bacterium]